MWSGSGCTSPAPTSCASSRPSSGSTPLPSRTPPRRPGRVVWIGLHEPSLDLLRQLQAGFGLHALTIEDALKAHQRPKLEQYGEALFVVARTAQMLDGRIAFGETHLFVGQGYVVSVRHGASTSYTPVRSEERLS